MERTQSIKLALAVALFLLSVGVSQAKEPVRIDASSEASAQASWDRMVAESGQETGRKLQVALIELNLAGVNSAFEVASNPDLQSLSVAHIKDKIAGLTADEIIELANKTSTVKVQQPAR